MQFTKAPDPSDPPAGSFDLSRLLGIALRRVWLLALCVALTVGGGVAYLLYARKVYTAVVTVQVEQAAQHAVVFQDEPHEEDYRAAEVLKTFEQILQSGPLLLRVAEVNGLRGTDGFLPKKPGSPPLTDSEVIDRMLGKVTVELRRGTRLIDVSVDDPDPVRAAKLARSVVEQYTVLANEQSLEVAQGNSGFLVAEEGRLRANTEASEAALAKYRAENQAVSLEDKQNIVVEKLKNLNAQVAEAKGKRLTLEADYNKLESMPKAQPEALLSLASIADAPEVADLRRQINAKEAEFAAIKQRYMYKHIKYIEAESNLQKLRAALDLEVGKAADVVRRSYQGAAEAENNLAQALHDQESEALKLQTTSIPYGSLERQAQSDRTLYENVLARLKETGVHQQSSYDVRTIGAPVVPGRPSKPSRLKILAAACAAGLLLGAGVIFVLELFNHTLQTVDQAEQALGLPLLAAVPERKKLRLQRGAGAVATEAPQREAFRTLCATLASIPRSPEARSFLFTSAVPDEGKSFCSLNFAANLAARGQQVLLINADLRRTYPFDKTLLHDGTAGLTECLTGAVPLAQAVHPTEVPNLFFCPAGKRVDNPAGLLTGENFAARLREALQVFDKVVVDTPPINAVSDCLLVAPQVDSVCLVVRALSTPVKAVWRAGRLLTMAKVTPAGFVLNRLPVGIGAKYSHYYYGEAYFREEERQTRQPAESKAG